MALRALAFVLLACVWAPPRAAADGASSHPARLAGLRALEAGKHDDAIRHLLHALEAHPDATLLLEDLIRASQKIPALHAIWKHRYVAALADKRGKFKPPKAMKAWFEAKDPVLLDVAKARARAAADLAKQVAAAKPPARLLVARVWADLLHAVMRDCPPLVAMYRDAAAKAVADAIPSRGEAIKAIENAASKAMRHKDPALAMRLGRAMVGLASQSSQDKTKRPSDETKRLRATGERLVRHAKTALADAQLEPLTVKALEAMDDAQIEAFNDKHTNMAMPGRALSPNGLYEIVTPCGHGTLLAAARHVEDVHACLAGWFGGDPFAKRRGQIRIFPEHADLESEDAPFWWAKGFQSGAVTTIHFALESVTSMMRVLTHELTHRFDGAFHPAQPGWLSEGRAVWTEGAWTKLSDLKLRPRYIDFGRVDRFWSWYGQERGLHELLTGTMDDYRDNYTAGHTLWVFLTTWTGDGDKPLFAEKTQAYLASMKNAPKDAVAHFASFFCDGEDGRPKSLKAFASELQRFVDGFESQPAAPWRKTYVGAATSGGGKRVFDGPVLSRARTREEPFFGQDHIRAAAHVLAALGENKASAGLFMWALHHDELRAQDLDVLESAVRVSPSGRAAPAAYMERLRRAAWPAPRETTPDRGVFVRPALQAYLDTLAAAAAARDAAGLVEAGDLYREEHGRLARPLGLPTLPSVPPGDEDTVLPEHRIPIDIGHRGWVEDALTGYDHWREKGLWMKTAEGHLVVGQNKAVTVAGEHVERFKEIFVRAKVPMRTGYALQARIHLLTPYVHGAIVVGYRRRHRNLRLQFETGARPRPGQTQPATSIEKVDVRVDSLRPLHDFAEDERAWKTLPITSTNNSFDVLVHVKGSRMECWIDGKRAGRATDADGLPLDGFIGFASEAGAYRIEHPVVRPLARIEPKSDRIPFDAQIHAPRVRMGDWLLGGRLLGASPSPYGTMVIWYPLGYFDGEESSMDEVERILRRRFRELRKLLDGKRHRADVLMVLPEVWPKMRNARFVQAAKKVLGDRVRVANHGEGTKRSPPDKHQYWGYEPSWMFLDPRGIVRAYSYRRLPDPDSSQEHGRENLFPWWLALTRGW